MSRTAAVLQLSVYAVALLSGEQVEVVADGFAFTEGPQWVHDEEVGFCM